MAVDKLVDSTQLDSDLTSVANAIRAKSGGSGQLAFPAGFVSEIQAIPSGGGIPAAISELDSGEFTVASASTTVNITTSLTNAPDFAFVFVKQAWKKSLNNASGKYIIFSQSRLGVSQGAKCYVVYGNDGSNPNGSYSFNTSTKKITFSNGMGLAPKFTPTQIVDSEGNTESISYVWVAGKFS